MDYNTTLAFPEYAFAINGSSHTGLSNRSQRIQVQGTLSKNFNLECGVPQGSCLGPLLYIIYAAKLFLKIIEHHLPDAHCYADDTQVYLSFLPADGLSFQIDVIQPMERCIEDIRHWMVSDCLLLNDDKMKFLQIGTRQQLNKVESIPLRIGTVDIEPSVSGLILHCPWELISIKSANLDSIIYITQEKLENTYLKTVY